MPFSAVWDETIPPGSEVISLGDNRIREFKTQFRERLAVDHHFLAAEGSDADIGFHEKVTLLNQSSDPTAKANALIKFAKDDSDPTPESEEFTAHESAGIIQRTSKGGGIAAVANLTNQDASTLNLGDVVVTHTSAESFQGTTSAGAITVRGVLMKQAASGGKSAVIKTGRFVVNVTGAVSIGDFLMTSTSKGLAQATTIYQPGVFAIAVTAASGGKCIADIFPVVKFVGFSGETRGDLIVRGSSLWQRLALITSGLFYSSDGTDVVGAFAFSKHKVIYTERNHDAVSGNVTYTVGFPPKIVVAFSNTGANDEFSMGAAGEDKSGHCLMRIGTGAQQHAANLINNTNNNINGQKADVSSYGSDTVLAWTLVGGGSAGQKIQHILIFLG